MSIVDNIKDIGRVIQQSDNIELYQKILTVQQDALELIDKLQKKTEENQQLSSDLQKALQIGEIKKGVKKVKNCYYEFDDKGNPINGPYCPTCLDGDNKIVHIISITGYRLQCPKCKIEFCDGKAGYYIHNQNLNGDLEVESKNRIRELNKQYNRRCNDLL
jgi:hypothetical protein